MTKEQPDLEKLKQLQIEVLLLKDAYFQLEKIKMDLEMRTKELEKFRKVAVGRELKMIELKKEIKNLTERLERCRKKKKIAQKMIIIK